MAQPPQSTDSQLLRLSVLAQLVRRAARALPRELPFIMVNETVQLAHYRQAALWDGGRIEAHSGVAVPDQGGPYIRWLAEVGQALAKGESPGAPGAFAAQHLPRHLAAEWAEWAPAHGLWCPLSAGPEQPQAAPPAALLLFRDDPWTDVDAALLAHLLDAYGQAFALSKVADAATARAWLAGRRRLWWAALGLALAVLCLPVRYSSLGQGEVTAHAPTLVRAPLDGVVAAFHVEPGAAVKAGQPLVSLDDAQLQSRLKVARKAYDIARSEYQQAAQEALLDPRVKARLATLQGKMEQEAAELAYVEELLSRLTVTAAHDGLAIYEDKGDWLGRPVQVGQKIILLADPADVELEIMLPAADAIELAPGSPVDFFPNVAPQRGVRAELTFLSYRAVPAPEGFMAYRLLARFADGQASGGPHDGLRVGLRGTAKVFGKRTALAVMLFRRPLSMARQWLAL